VHRREVAPGLHGLVAAELISKGDLILDVPRELSITPNKVKQGRLLTVDKVSYQVVMLQDAGATTTAGPYRI